MSNEASGSGTASALASIEREVDAGFGHQPAGMLQLAGGKIKPDGSGAPLRQRDRPLRRAAPELQDVPALDRAEHLELRFGDLGGAPRRSPAVGELGAVALLVFVAVGVPRIPVVCGVRRQVGRIGGHDRMLAPGG